jgi:hypothetical protein
MLLHFIRFKNPHLVTLEGLFSPSMHKNTNWSALSEDKRGKANAGFG